jgi:N-acetyl-anhydromuramyl-L-alanine amidase AmpD
MAKFTNSSLATYIKISPNKSSGRQGHKIDTISIHCMAGDLSVEACGQMFAKSSTQASSNYGVDSRGKIGLYVEEKDRSWCTSSSANDNRAVTIEVASGSKHPYKVNDKAYQALITLLVDICKRNNIKSLKWKGKKSLIGQVDKQNMTDHRWFSNKACPGDYLYNRHGKIAKAVNERLGKDTSRPPGMPSNIEDDIIDESNDGYDDESSSMGGGVNIQITDETELALGNSSLASYINRIDSQNTNPRDVMISAITIHSAKSTGSLEAFAKMIKSSSTTYNYAIDSNGKIGLFVDEPYATNASKNATNDARSVNIACMNTSLDPEYAISDECYNALIDLCEDICRRRGIGRFEYEADKPDISTLTLHEQFHPDAKCPGNYIKKGLSR